MRRPRLVVFVACIVTDVDLTSYDIVDDIICCWYYARD